MKTREQNKMEQTWSQDIEKSLKGLNFDWEKNGPLIPLLLMFVFIGVAFIASTSRNSWLSTPYTIAAIVSGLIYFVIIIFRKTNTPKYRHVR
ncbi:hypothetical protein FJY84_02665 [Candidatus Bathyarchaeota archaeon]|nr:hypothetical protein [Candidatus Bathyarchaeota archaeon]